MTWTDIEPYWTRTSRSSLQLVRCGQVIMCVMRTFTFDEEKEWLVYDPNLVNPVYLSFSNIRDAKTYCEVTAKLCGF